MVPNLFQYHFFPGIVIFFIEQPDYLCNTFLHWSIDCLRCAQAGSSADTVLWSVRTLCADRA